MAQKLWAHAMARPQCAPLKAHGGIAKAALTRAFAAERVTRIELAWPAWKVAVAVRRHAIPDGGVCSGDAVSDRLQPFVMAG